MIIYKELPLNEWERLKPLYTEIFPDRPFPEDPRGSAVVVAEKDGEIVAFHFMHLCAHAEPLGVHPTEGKGVNLLTLFHTLEGIFKDKPGMEYYITAVNDQMGNILEGQGFVPVGVLFSKLID